MQGLPFHSPVYNTLCVQMCSYVMKGIRIGCSGGQAKQSPLLVAKWQPITGCSSSESLDRIFDAAIKQ